MSNQSERYHIDLFRPEYEMPEYNINLRGMRTPYGNLETNMFDKLIQNLTMQLDQSINLGQQGAGQTPNIKMPDIESLKPSLEYNLQKDNIGFGAGINVPSQGGMMDWLIKLSLGF